MSHTSEIWLSLLILNLGITFGAGLYETKIVVPLWFRKSNEAGYWVNTDAIRETNVGRRFWAFVTTGPLTLITLANLFVAWQTEQNDHTWWLAAVYITLIERVGTFMFFIPTAIKLEKSDGLPSPTVNRLAALWIRFNYVRNGLTLIAWVCALSALTA